MRLDRAEGPVGVLSPPIKVHGLELVTKRRRVFQVAPEIAVGRDPHAALEDCPGLRKKQETVNALGNLQQDGINFSRGRGQNQSATEGLRSLLKFAARVGHRLGERNELSWVRHDLTACHAWGTHRARHRLFTFLGSAA